MTSPQLAGVQLQARLELEPLRQDQYRQVAEWEFGPQPPDTDWQRYADEMNAPKWAHFGLYDAAEFVGCLSLEKVGAKTVAYHVVTARRKIHPDALAQVLLKTAGDLFAMGYAEMIAQIPIEKRAAAMLAQRCGMHENGSTPKVRSFSLTKTRYQQWEQRSPSR